MNTRFITVISSIALVSTALSSGTNKPSSTALGGSTSIPKQSTNNITSDLISSTIPVMTTTTISTSPFTTRSSIKSSQPAGPETTASQVPSATPNAPVANTTRGETKETTAIRCDCSKYLSTSTANKNTESTTTPTSSPTTAAPKKTTTAKPNISTSAVPTKPNISARTTPTSLPPTNTTVKPKNSATTAKPTSPTTTNTTAKPKISNTATPTSPTTTNTTAKPKISNTATPTSLTTTNTTAKPKISNTATPASPTTTNTTAKPKNSNTATPTSPTTTNTTAKPKISTTATPTSPTTTATNTTAKPKISNTATLTSPTTTSTTAKPKISNTATPTSPTTTNTTTKPKISNTATPTSPTTTTTASITTTKPTTTQTTLINHHTVSASSKVRRRRDITAKVDMIQHSTSIVYDDTKTSDVLCMKICNITMNETTKETSLTTTTERTTTTPRHRSIDLRGKSVVLQLVIVVNDTFTSDMTDKSSKVYNDLANQYTTSLTTFYSDLLQRKFRKIFSLGFSNRNGSIKCNYSLETTAPANESEANSTLQELRDVKWKTNSLINLTIDVNKTNAEQIVPLANDSLLLPVNVCAYNEVLDWDKNGNPECKYKCDIPENKNHCGDHGECVFTYEGSIRCICTDGYSGIQCKNPKPTTTTAKPTKPDAIALSKTDIIGIAAGIGGGLVLILLVALCCLCTRLNNAKKRDRFYGYMDNDKEFLHDENSRIENVPEYTNQGYQREEGELQMQRFEPEGKNVDYEPGQRQGAYEREDNAYRKVEEPEGGNVLIYQPKHLRGPMERQSGASKFDEVEERSHPYRMMDTDTTYKIRRPTVNSDKNVPYN